jgi:hypothetical protein
MRTLAAAIAAFLFALVISLPVQSLRGSQGSSAQIEWVARSLKEMQTIKVGMTRAELMKVFTTEGGLSGGLSRTYVYRECPYFKVDVEFRPVGRPVRDRAGRVTLTEAKGDVIMKISKPYLGWSIID